jgi:CheY-like chemotaxis protein
MGQSTPPTKQAVLVVEDEPLLRMMAMDLVEDAGFQAVEAADADEAVTILETRTDIRIVFTDIGCRARPLAADRDHHRVGAGPSERGRSAGAQRVLFQTLRLAESDRHAASHGQALMRKCPD